MKKTRTFRFPVLLLLCALTLGLLCSCVSNTPLVISGDDEEEEEIVDASEVGGKGTFEYALNDAGYYEISGYIPNSTEIVDIEIPDMIGGIEVTSIGAQAFYYCTYIRSIKIPASVTAIGNYAFAGCTYLEKLEIPDTVKTIGEGLFAYCSSLTDVKLPASTTKIPAHTFSGCSSLKEFPLSNVITEIGDGAFKDCAALTTVTIPDSVVSLGDMAYYNCASLSYFKVGDQLDFVIEMDDEGEYVINEKESTIGQYALYRFAENIEIVYPENSGMAVYYAYYELDKTPPSLETEAETTEAAA